MILHKYICGNKSTAAFEKRSLLLSRNFYFLSLSYSGQSPNILVQWFSNSLVFHVFQVQSGLEARQKQLYYLQILSCRVAPCLEGDKCVLELPSGILNSSPMHHVSILGYFMTVLSINEQKETNVFLIFEQTKFLLKTDRAHNLIPFLMRKWMVH